MARAAARSCPRDVDSRCPGPISLRRRLADRHKRTDRLDRRQSARAPGRLRARAREPGLTERPRRASVRRAGQHRKAPVGARWDPLAAGRARIHAIASAPPRTSRAASCSIRAYVTAGGPRSRIGRRGSEAPRHTFRARRRSSERSRGGSLPAKSKSPRGDRVNALHRSGSPDPPAWPLCAQRR